MFQNGAMRALMLNDPALSLLKVRLSLVTNFKSVAAGSKLESCWAVRRPVGLLPIVNSFSTTISFLGSGSRVCQRSIA